MPLSKLHVINVCKFGAKQGECRYLEEDAVQPNVYNCLKLSPHRKIIDEEVEQYSRKARYGGKRYIDDMPVGDNCKGYPVLRHKTVGYDQQTS